MMKYVCLIVGCMFLLSGTCFAELPSQIDYSPVFQEGDTIFQFGVGFGAPDVPDDMSIPPISLAADYAVPISNMGLPFSFGGYYAFARYDYSDYDFTFHIFGARILFHFNLVDNIDLYAGFMAGYRSITTDLSHTVYDNQFEIGEIVGGRWFFSDKTALYGEVGYHFPYASLGLSIKF